MYFRFFLVIWYWKWLRRYFLCSLIIFNKDFINCSCNHSHFEVDVPLFGFVIARSLECVTLSLYDSHIRANLYEIGYESMPEEHGRTHFYKWYWSQQTGKYRNMNKPQSHKNTAHIIIGSRNTTLIYDNTNFNSLHGTWLYDLRTHD